MEKLIYGGMGLARLGGRVLFVPGSLPGEVVQASVEEDRGDYLRGRLLAVCEASRLRREPSCPYYEDCGGCHLQHLQDEEQLASKVDVLMEMLRRQLRQMEIPDPIPIAGPPWRYRRSARFQLQWLPELKIGFYQPRSRHLVDLRQCPLLCPALNDSLARFRSQAKSIDIKEIHKAVGWKTISTWEGGETLSVLLDRPAHRDEEPKVLSYISEEASNLRAHPPGRDFAMQDRVGRWQYRIHPLSFFQANGFLAPRLLELVEEHCRTSGSRSLAVDLYAGSGFFTLPLSAHFSRTVAVEKEPLAARLAEENARMNACRGIDRAFCTVEEWIQAEQMQAKAAIDLLLVDPPREGLGRAVSEWVLRKAPQRILYVSCSPPTLARDLKRWEQAGSYRMVQLYCLDLFPQTFHLETVAVLDRME